MRFCKDINSDFYIMKSRLIEFMQAMVEGHNEEILEYIVTNFEIKNIESVMVNSLCLLYNFFTSKLNITQSIYDL